MQRKLELYIFSGECHSWNRKNKTEIIDNSDIGFRKENNTQYKTNPNDRLDSVTLDITF